VTVAQAQLVDVVRQLQVLRFLLLGIAASLPARRAAEPEEPQGVSARIRADIECVLADSIAPAIQSLERAARYAAAAPEEG
jgi:methyl coenzyme M reductase alpha subunit